VTFSCKNFDHDDESCRKLGGECIPGRPGCVLDGQFTLSEELQARLADLERATLARKGKKD
jgi:hypothetical protein